MSKNTPANDYALAKILNEHLIKIFALLDDDRDLPDYTALVHSYVLLGNEVRQIYARQPKLQNIGEPICWQVMKSVELFHENIGEYKTLAYEYTHSGADYGQEHNSSVNMLCIENKVNKLAVPPHIRKLLNAAESNIKAFQHELDKLNATLSFEKLPYL